MGPDSSTSPPRVARCTLHYSPHGVYFWSFVQAPVDGRGSEQDFHHVWNEISHRFCREDILLSQRRRNDAPGTLRMSISKTQKARRLRYGYLNRRAAAARWALLDLRLTVSLSPIYAEEFFSYDQLSHSSIPE
jgi:hypothetical protein